MARILYASIKPPKRFDLLYLVRRSVDPMRLSGRTGRDDSGNARVLFHMARMINARATSLQVRGDKSERRCFKSIRGKEKSRLEREASLDLEEKREQRFTRLLKFETFFQLDEKSPLNPKLTIFRSALIFLNREYILSELLFVSWTFAIFERRYFFEKKKKREHEFH